MKCQGRSVSTDIGIQFKAKPANLPKRNSFCGDSFVISSNLLTARSAWTRLNHQTLKLRENPAMRQKSCWPPTSTHNGINPIPRQRVNNTCGGQNRSRPIGTGAVCGAVSGDRADKWPGAWEMGFSVGSRLKFNSTRGWFSKCSTRVVKHVGLKGTVDLDSYACIRVGRN